MFAGLLAFPLTVAVHRLKKPFIYAGFDNLMTDETRMKHGLKTDNLTLNQKLDWLIDRWCERRALPPLRFLLAAYPSALVHTDQFGDLLEKLRDVKGLCRNELTPEELTLVISAINELEDLTNKQ